ncbi:lactosylceramide 4-alpha-galactosyltransferase-like [Macrosteles quadrilineatus]|uniref:lactosylceramide 4-alpha-galactosyltransferase-like n=1 Tax=Macrosteles quadrilineatus TaxID=74068 RepID=UPI0023E2D97D|nr:lactosylceramide 4-alpha-galactosyltransferase-like [Macrosteles quadrilineatus]
MKDSKRFKLVFLISFFSICLLYVIAGLLATGDYVPKNEDGYFKVYISSTKSQKVATADVADATESSNHNATEYILLSKSEPNSSFDNQNITETDFKTESETIKTLKKVYAERQKVGGRKLFVGLADIRKSTENIFFIESTCATEKMAAQNKDNKGFVLNARQCCAIESTAEMNLDHKVYIFHSCPLDDNFFKYSPKFVEKLFKLPNIHVVRLNTTEIFAGSPLEDLHRKKLLETSDYPVEHTSDLVRLTLLWRFGGTYCDLDVITIRSLNKLKTNWAGMQDAEVIANGVLNFEPEGVGHQILQRALEHVNKHYDPNDWSANGPLLITPIILQECKVQKVTEAQKHCNGNFTVLEKTILYTIYYESAGDFFQTNLGEKIVSYIKQSSYSVHFWNKMSHNMLITVGSTQAYGLLADEYCPLVYRNCGLKF